MKGNRAADTKNLDIARPNIKDQMEHEGFRGGFAVKSTGNHSTFRAKAHLYQRMNFLDR